ncbi:hypothetical protein BJ684DRAFT_17910 [Piptocephalis cylindrospora]|uniref:Uncharacterized protein n=1 Tax=Piptocephalis cylindrospora TaxID=1907219 RepID=A0A4P9XYJ9_9FUNG|nr:hypothetical protein BJ684DRAFT_17910 [Piptocephalis cylindrospora]|eukprot:RKP11505.1 hypothetical protein BJ684DRAFT_17910 [Piptocephalis cylindrospora]
MALDGIFPAGKYRGILLITTAMDAQNHLFPVSLGIAKESGKFNFECIPKPFSRLLCAPFRWKLAKIQMKRFGRFPMEDSKGHKQSWRLPASGKIGRQLIFVEKGIGKVGSSILPSGVVTVDERGCTYCNKATKEEEKWLMSISKSEGKGTKGSPFIDAGGEKKGEKRRKGRHGNFLMLVGIRKIEGLTAAVTKGFSHPLGIPRDVVNYVKNGMQGSKWWIIIIWYRPILPPMKCRLLFQSKNFGQPS